MQYLLQIFDGISFSSIIIFVAAMCFLGNLIIKAYKGIVNFHDSLQERDKLIKETSDDIKEIRKDYTNLSSQVTEILERQNKIEVQQKNIEEKNKKYNLNKTRDRLLSSYRYYVESNSNPSKAWSEMEKEAFYSLFQDYEELGGNGFMHTTVEPAVASLTVVKMSDKEGLTKLMESRKG